MADTNSKRRRKLLKMRQAKEENVTRRKPDKNPIKRKKNRGRFKLANTEMMTGQRTVDMNVESNSEPALVSACKIAFKSGRWVKVEETKL